MLCRLFCKWGKQCHSDLEAEERRNYRNEINQLVAEVDRLNNIIVLLTEENDEYELELNRVQDLYKTETDIVNQLMTEANALNKKISNLIDEVDRLTDEVQQKYE